ncbi:D-alanyl-D-alanine endopeptidase [Pandoraea pnomenusa]|uniref:D-alanyl-D-alanine endopeptidase n=1 Tax=Pandoraea pnomenusa TaxID=93220 RepID=A0A378YVB8_9BURK|nr:D-alanyl-D-alanine endopeptidase precursor [Pandoraea pnomenusa]VVE66907.1 D-alanyl-D-alanine endopeptidase [Pandoraea pnomenusa]
MYCARVLRDGSPPCAAVFLCMHASPVTLSLRNRVKMSALWYLPLSPDLPRLYRLPPRTIALARFMLFGVILLIAGLPVSDALAASTHTTSTGKRRNDAVKQKSTAKASAKSAHRKTATASHSRKRATRHAKAMPARKGHQARRHAKSPRHAKAANAAKVSAKPRLLARCGFTPASRKRLFSRAVYIVDEKTHTPLFAKNADQVRPIASLSKLMTAVVWLDSGPSMRTPLTVTQADLDTLKFTRSRLLVGSTLSRADMLHISLMASENRAAAALSRDYPGGRPAFIAAMNAKARALNMPNTRFENSTGLSPRNVSTARELARLVRASNRYALIRRYSIDHQQRVRTGKGQLQYVNTNRLVRYGKVHASVQKTGFINESGHNMVMRVMVHKQRPVIVTMLGSDTPEGSRLDGVRIAHWLSCSLR